MSDILFIRPRDLQAGHWQWRTADDDGTSMAGSGRLAEAAAFAPGRRVVLLVPGEEVLLTRAQIPLRSRARAASAAPWALEDRLVAEVDRLHFALGSPAAPDNWPVAVVARDTLERCLAACTESGLAPHAAVPEPLALPVPESGNWTALEEADRVVCRTGPASGFACARPLLAVVSESHELPGAIALTRVEGVAAEWPAPLDERISHAVPAADPLQAFADAQPAIDLLQGPYSRRERLGRIWRRWRVPAALAATLALLLLVQWGVAYRELGQRQQALRSAAEDILRAAVPDVGRIVDPRVQLKNRLDQLRGGSAEEETGLLALLGIAGPVLAQRDEVTLTALAWRGGNLDLSVTTDELPVMDRLQRGLQAVGLQVELRGAERSEGSVRGEVRVREGDA